MKAVAVIFLFLFSLPSFSTVIGDLAAQMKPGDWRELTTTGLSQPFLQTSGDNCCNVSILQYAAKAQWNPATQQFLFLGSPHDNPSKLILYSAATNAWTTGTVPEACYNHGHVHGGCAVHSYYYSSIDAGQGLFYFYHAGKKTINEYDVAKKTWRIMGGALNVYDASYGGLVFFPERDGFIYASGGSGNYWYSRAQDKWTANVPYSSTTYHLFALYNPLYHIALFGGGNGDKRVMKMDTAGKVTALASAPAPIGTNNGNVTCDPVSGELLLYSSGNTFYKYNAPANQWTQVSTQIPAAFATSFDPAQGIAAAPVSTYGVVMYLTYNPTKVYLYKHAEGTKTEEKVAGGRMKGEIGLRVSPNPVIGSRATIRVPSAHLSSLYVDVYDLRGRRVALLPIVQGRAVFEGRDDQGRRLTPGLYSVVYRAGGSSETTSLLLTK